MLDKQSELAPRLLARAEVNITELLLFIEHISILSSMGCVRCCTMFFMKKHTSWQLAERNCTLWEIRMLWIVILTCRWFYSQALLPHRLQKTDVFIAGQLITWWPCGSLCLRGQYEKIKAVYGGTHSSPFRTLPRRQYCITAYWSGLWSQSHWFIISHAYTRPRRWCGLECKENPERRRVIYAGVCMYRSSVEASRSSGRPAGTYGWCCPLWCVGPCSWSG